jgi:hypothetical protein
MWAIPRGVELKSFESFDDKVGSLSSSTSGLYVSIENLLIKLSLSPSVFKEVMKIESRVLGLYQLGGFLYVAVKNRTSITVQKFSTDFVLSIQNVKVKILEAPCITVYTENFGPSSFLFGLQDGSILSYQGDNAQFDLVAFTGVNISSVCRAGETFVVADEKDTITLIDVVTGQSKNSIVGNP